MNYRQLRKRLGINFLRSIEKTTTKPFTFNEAREIKRKKLVKKIKNYKRDWWKGDMERTIKNLS